MRSQGFMESVDAHEAPAWAAALQPDPEPPALGDRQALMPRMQRAQLTLPKAAMWLAMQTLPDGGHGSEVAPSVRSHSEEPPLLRL
jgi:hypothetical protein